MCNSGCINFGVRHLTKDIIEGKRVIELGSFNVNGSLRSHIMSFNPSEYIGTDIKLGPGVDVVCSAEACLEKFGLHSFDVVITTEMLEHIINWKNVINSIKMLCKPNGIVLITTRSFGFPKHDWPVDFWRYEVEDMTEIFSDFQVIETIKDFPDPGVFMVARKPANMDWIMKDLSNYKLYSMVHGERV